MADLIPLPAPQVRVEQGVVLANSRDVAEFFAKRHDHVLRALRDIPDEPAPKLGAAWFRDSTYIDANGQERPCVDMTKDGFTLLVMGFTGERAMAFKVEYIRAFNALEERVRNLRGSSQSDDLLAGLNSIADRISVRFELSESAVIEHGRVLSDHGAMLGNHDRILAHHDRMLSDWDKRRKRVTKATQREHLRVASRNKVCPCCGVAPIVQDGCFTAEVEIDHFHSKDRPDAQETWPICRPCHVAKTQNHYSHTYLDARFKAYQALLSHMRNGGNDQPGLFSGW
jgi:Rha family phage regulatory protein